MEVDHFRISMFMLSAGSTAHLLIVVCLHSGLLNSTTGLSTPLPLLESWQAIGHNWILAILGTCAWPCDTNSNPFTPWGLLSRVTRTYYTQQQGSGKPLHTIVHRNLLYRYIVGRYNKYSRNLSQSPWIIDGERKGLSTSVSELLSTPLIEYTRSEGMSFASWDCTF